VRKIGIRASAVLLAMCCVALLAAEVWAFVRTDMGNNTDYGSGYRGSGGDEDGVYLSAVITSHGVTYEMINFTVEACCISCAFCDPGLCGIMIWGDYVVNDQGCNPGPSQPFDNSASPCQKCDSITIAHFVRHAKDGGQYPDSWQMPSKSVTITANTECYCCDTLWSPLGVETINDELLPR